ncbi:MAG: hypothetical protein QOF18_3070 [Frankiaceae bacterium]|nr:hypothetical protein [Frankiaceae bacterium]
MTTLPFGAWPSPISATDVARKTGEVGGAAFVDAGHAGGPEPWWAEVKADEGGRTTICRTGADGGVETLLAAPWNVRTRVHEYGGGAWTVIDGVLVFANYDDQRLYRCLPGEEPVALTAAPAVPAAWRYADLVAADEGRAVMCVRESHGDDGTVSRDVCLVPLDGSAAENAAAIRSVVAGSHFLAYPRVSPDGRRLAWIAWEHPQMPWDGAELRVADLDELGVAGRPRTLLGSTTESVVQPVWADNDSLYVSSDRTGWWNLYRIAADGGEPIPLCPQQEDHGGPLWVFGLRWFAPLDDGRLLVVRTFGTSRLGIVDQHTGAMTDVAADGMDDIRLCGVSGNRALVLGGGSTTPWGLRTVDLLSGHVEDIRTTADSLPDPDFRSPGQSRVFTGPEGRDVHAIIYPPHHPDVTGPDGARPPYVVHVHGGPTSHVAPRVDPKILYFTSRGIGVVDVNYGGSTGYGRDYRERLRGQWGIVDVEDVVAVARGLAESGDADGARIAIEGGSAGGWTVLAALTTTDAFCCGISYFGVAELIEFAQHTHDFESRYLDGLVGPWPEAQSVYEQRAPVNNVEGLSCPVLLLQGLDDPIVPPSQAEVFRDALVRKGIPHAYIAYAGESHGFRRAETIVSALESSLSFYGQVMGFSPVGVATLELVTA